MSCEMGLTRSTDHALGLRVEVGETSEQHCHDELQPCLEDRCVVVVQLFSFGNSAELVKLFLLKFFDDALDHLARLASSRLVTASLAEPL